MKALHRRAKVLYNDSIINPGPNVLAYHKKLLLGKSWYQWRYLHVEALLEALSEKRVVFWIDTRKQIKQVLA